MGAILTNQEKTGMVRPIHLGKEIKLGLCIAILREDGINREKICLNFEGEMMIWNRVFAFLIL